MHFPEDMVSLEKWIPEKPISAIYFNMTRDRYFIKRFLAGSQNTDQKFIPEGSKIQLEMISTEWKPVIEITFSKSGKNVRGNEIKNIEEVISVKGIKAIGNQLSSYKIINIDQLKPIEYTPPEKPTLNELEVDSEEINENEAVIESNNNNVVDGQTELEF
jgi:topoisomerase-4 subunit A